jgi:hypothetical protein
MNRRNLFSMLAAPAFALIFSSSNAIANPNPRRRIRGPIRVRRRIRRHAFTRVMFGRPFWVVPVGLAVGWELDHRNRVVIVKETRIIERDGRKTEVAIVEDNNGKVEQIDITREDTAGNSRNLRGNEVPEGDATTPTVEDDSND